MVDGECSEESGEVTDLPELSFAGIQTFLKSETCSLDDIVDI